VLKDGSFTEAGRAADRAHILGATLQSFGALRVQAAECCERSLAIAILIRDHHVIQFDGDTLTVGGISDVREWVPLQPAFCARHLGPPATRQSA